VKFYKITLVSEHPLRKRKHDIPREKGFRRVWFDRYGKPSRFTRRKALYGYRFQFQLTREGRKELKRRAEERQARAVAEKAARESVPKPWKKLKWQPIRPYVDAVLKKFKIPLQAWDASIGGAMAMIPDFSSKLVYMPLQFFYDEPLTRREMGFNGEKALPGNVGYMWVVVRVPMSLKQYVIDGRLYFPKKEKVYADLDARGTITALCGLPMTWTPLEGKKVGKSSRLKLEIKLISVKEFHYYLTQTTYRYHPTRKGKRRMPTWKEGIYFYARHTKERVVPLHFLGFTMRLIPGG
jgi:hypothetical protein